MRTFITLLLVSICSIAYTQDTIGYRVGTRPTKDICR